MSFSQITSVDLVVNQITTIVTRYTPSSPAGINTVGDIAPTETIVRTSSNVGLNRINTTPIWSNSVQVYNSQYTLSNNTFNYDAVRGVTGNDARSVISGAGSYGTETFTYNNQNLGGVVATTPVVDRGASLGNQNFPVYDSVPTSKSIDPVSELSDTQPVILQGGSLVFDGATQYLTVTVGVSTALTFGTNPFTIECWFFLTGTAGNYAIYDARTGGSVVAINLYFQGSNNLSLMVSGTNVIAGGTAVTAGVWHHVALSKNSGSTRLFLDGIQIGSTYTDANNYLSGIPTIGHNAAAGGGANFFPGYITNLRVVNGTGLYTTYFTPSPTAANIANTQLLLSVSSSGTYLKDSSVNNFGFTNVGAVAYSTFAQFTSGTPSYYTTQYFNSGLNIPYGDITANVSAYSAQTYTVPGTYSWTVPAGVYSITLGAVGAGGGGVQKTGGGAGGSGANVAYNNSYTVTPGDTYTIVVGTGGAPGAVFGTTGGSTYMTQAASTVAIVVAGGGAGGNSLYWQTDDVSVRALDTTGVIARVTAVDPNARTITYNISSGSLPIGAALNTANGAITWTKQNLSSATEYAPFTVSATVSLPTQVISKRYTIQIVTISYSITANKTGPLLYGDSVIYYFRTSGVADGTILYWSNAGTTTSDEFIDAINSGPITITSGAFNLTRTLTTFQSVIGSSRNIIIQLRTGSTSGTVVATGPTTEVQPQSFALSSNVASMNEGTMVQYTLTTGNIISGTTVYWTDSGNVVAGRFADTVTSGSVVVTANTAIINRSVINNLSNDGVTNITLQLRDYSTTARVLTTATPVTVNDTSRNTTIEYLVIGAGGGASSNTGFDGGGGAGGMVVGSTNSVNFSGSMTVTVGGGSLRQNGGDSVLGPIAGYGGGYGGTNTTAEATALGHVRGRGGNGGSGGGGTYNSGTAGSPTQISFPAYGGTGYGFSGRATGGSGGGAGGGAGGVGGTNTSPTRASSITGVSVNYAGGGHQRGGNDQYVANSGNGSGAGATIPSSEGVVIIAHPIDGYLPITVGSGLTYTTDSVTRAGYLVYRFTAGSGTITLPP